MGFVAPSFKFLQPRLAHKGFKALHPETICQDISRHSGSSIAVIRVAFAFVTWLSYQNCQHPHKLYILFQPCLVFGGTLHSLLILQHWLSVISHTVQSPLSAYSLCHGFLIPQSKLLILQKVIPIYHIYSWPSTASTDSTQRYEILKM